MLYKFGTAKQLLRWGKICGIFAGVLMMFQALLAARFRFLDKIFGLDRLWRFHRYNGIVLALPAVCHPVLILWSEDFSFFPFEKRYWPAFLGIGVLSLLSGMVVTAALRRQIKMDWQKWFISHRIGMPLIFILVFVHVSHVSKPFEAGLPYMLLLASFTAAMAFVLMKWIMALGLFSHQYSVLSVRKLAKNAWGVRAGPVPGGKFNFLPGQFAFVTPVSSKIPRESHPFTIASSPETQNYLEFVIRSCGDFTDRVRHLAPGDKILINGPYGRFSHCLVKEKLPVVMIAGGIGITPMISMLRTLAVSKGKQKIVLIWSNQTREHIVFGRELSALKSQIDEFSIHHILTRECSQKSEYQRLNKESLSSVLGAFPRKSHVFLCGPPGLCTGLMPVLSELGFSRARVYTESFVL
jgi:predicted ferric reductase